MRDLDSPYYFQSGASLPCSGASHFTRDPNAQRRTFRPISADCAETRERSALWGGRVCNLITNRPESGLMRDLDSSGDGDH